MSYIDGNFIYEDSDFETLIGVVDYNAIYEGVLDIPTGVKRIKRHAFANAINIYQINIPSTIIDIEDRAFDGVPNLAKILPKEGVPTTEVSPTYHIINNVVIKSIGDEPNNNFEIVACPQGLRGVVNLDPESEYPFSEQDKNILVKISSVANYAFYRCSYVSSIRLSSNIESIFIGDYAFADCYRLGSNDCVGLTLLKVGNYAFRNNRQMSNSKITIESQDIGISAFKACIGLRTLTLCLKSSRPITVGESSRPITVGEQAFAECKNLLMLRLESDADVTFGQCCFYNDELLSLFDIDENTLKKTIKFKNRCFMGCGFNTWNPLKNYWLKTAEDTLPTYQEPIYIGEVFYGCYSLYEVHISTVNTNNFDSLFFGCTRIHKLFIYRKQLVNNSGVSDRDEIYGYIAPLGFAKNSKISSLEIEGVNKIRYSAFRGCASLPSVVIPKSVTVLERWAFAYCQFLSYVNIKNAEVETDGDVFQWSNAIKTAYIPLKSNNDTRIVRGVWKNLSNAVELHQSSENWIEGVDTIPPNYYDGCYALERVFLDSHIRNIGEYAFNNCYSLKYIYFPAQFNINEGISEYSLRGCYNLSSISIAYSPSLNELFKRGGKFSSFGLTDIELRAITNNTDEEVTDEEVTVEAVTVKDFLNSPDIYNNLQKIIFVNETGKFIEILNSFTAGTLISKIDIVDTVNAIKNSFLTTGKLTELYIRNPNAQICDSFGTSSPLQHAIFPIKKIEINKIGSPKPEMVGWLTYFNECENVNVKLGNPSIDNNDKKPYEIPYDILFSDTSDKKGIENRMSSLEIANNITSVAKDTEGNEVVDKSIVFWHLQNNMEEVSSTASLLTGGFPNLGCIRLGLDLGDDGVQRDSLKLHLVANKNDGKINVGYYGFSTVKWSKIVDDEVVPCDKVVPCLTGTKSFNSLTFVSFNKNQGDKRYITINEGAFFMCDSLSEVEGLSGVSSIEDLAFFGCGNLKRVSISGHNPVIGGGAFNGTNQDFSLFIENTDVNNGLYYEYENTNRLLFMFNSSGSMRKLVSMLGDVSRPSIIISGSDANIFADHVFMGSNILRELTANEVKVVPKYAFANCVNLESVTMNGIDDTNPLENIGDAIGEYAFYNCPNLKHVSFSALMERIGAHAFELLQPPMSGTVTMLIPNTLKYVGVSAFENRTDFRLMVGMPAERFKMVFRLKYDEVNKVWSSDTGLTHEQIVSAIHTCS